MVTEFTVVFFRILLFFFLDSFQILSDILALGVALWAKKVPVFVNEILTLYKFLKKDLSKTMTYGWRRAKVVGVLANGIFLLALV